MSQSRLCAAILGWARDEGIGFSHFISTGNMLDCGFGDLLEALADDPQAKSIVLYVEAIPHALGFLSAARRCTARKPVIVYKAGRSAAGAKAAGSHTGSMAGEDAVYEAVFDEGGIIRVTASRTCSRPRSSSSAAGPAASRLAIVTNAGGPGVIAADAPIAGRGGLCPLSPSTTAPPNASMPPPRSRTNPVDVIGDAPRARLALPVAIVAGDENVDRVLVILTPQSMIDVAHAGRLVAAVAVAVPSRSWRCGWADHWRSQG